MKREREGKEEKKGKGKESKKVKLKKLKNGRLGKEIKLVATLYTPDLTPGV